MVSSSYVAGMYILRSSTCCNNFCNFRTIEKGAIWGPKEFGWVFQKLKLHEVLIHIQVTNNENMQCYWKAHAWCLYHTAHFMERWRYTTCYWANSVVRHGLVFVSQNLLNLAKLGLFIWIEQTYILLHIYMDYTYHSFLRWLVQFIMFIFSERKYYCYSISSLNISLVPRPSQTQGRAWHLISHD